MSECFKKSEQPDDRQGDLTPLTKDEFDNMTHEIQAFVHDKLDDYIIIGRRGLLIDEETDNPDGTAILMGGSVINEFLLMEELKDHFRNRIIPEELLKILMILDGKNN